MNHLFLSGTRRDELVSMVYRFGDLLDELGAGCVVVTPDGTAPDWCRASAATVSEAWALPRIAAEDTVIFTSPDQYPTVGRLPGRLLFYCMDPTANVAPVLADCRVTTLTPSPRTAAVVRERFGGEPIDVGLSIADVFFHAGDRKQSGMVAVLADSAEPSTGHLADTLRNLRVVRIEDLPEADAAAALRASEFFLFLSQARRSPLAVIEALAAGCVVLSVPTEHVAACLVDGVNGVLAAEALLGARLLDLCAPAARVRRSALYDRGRATASAFRRARHGRHVAALLEGPLAFLRS